MLSRDYQRRKNNKYILPDNLYRSTLYIIRDYDRLKEEYDYLIGIKGIEADGQPKGNFIGNPTASAAQRAEITHERIKAIEEAKSMIPPEYRKGVWQNVLYGSPYPYDAHRNTYGIYKARFIHTVAKKLKLTE